MRPLIELPPHLFRAPAPRAGKPQPKPPAGDAVVRTFVAALGELPGHDPLYIDLSLLGPRFTVRGQPVWGIVADAVLNQSIPAAVPVVTLDDPPEATRVIAKLARTHDRGACIRVKPVYFGSPNLMRLLSDLLRGLRLGPEQVDLLVDYEEFYDASPNLATICAALPALSRWRSFTVLSGAFPEDLQRFRKNEEKLVPRSDWQRWLAETRNDCLPRTPNYGDYTVQFARYRPPISNPNPSASIRYALENDWLVLRGEGINNPTGPGRRQWTGWAMLLTKRSEYFGPEFSEGDRYISERANFSLSAWDLRNVAARGD